MRYPNNKCGECPVWLAVETMKEIIAECEKRHCNLLEEENINDCDGRCLNCDDYDPIQGCTKEKDYT